MVRFLCFALLICGVLGGAISPSFAQQNPDDLLLEFQKRLQAGESDLNETRSPMAGNAASNGMRPNAQGVGQKKQAEPLSQIETVYRDRLQQLLVSDQKKAKELNLDQQQEDDPDTALRQIGYDVLKNNLSAPSLTGAVNDHYILGVGDELRVVFRGQNNGTTKVSIDRNGQVILPNLPPLDAAGRSFGDFRADLESQVASSMISTNVFATLGEIRQVSILVSGEVEKPGSVSVNGLSTVVDALISAGGIRKTGSLRSVQVVRAGQVQTLDLYPLLFGYGSLGDISLREGDQIIVPVIGPTIALFNGVSRPGIYELQKGSIPLQTALQLAGGPISGTGQRYLKISRSGDGREIFSEYASLKGGTLTRGDMFGAISANKGTRGTVYLSGHVYEEGWRSLSALPSLRAFLSKPGLLREEPYLPFVVIKRVNPNTLSPEYVAVDGSRLLKQGEDFPLLDQDRVIILSLSDVQYLISEDVARVLQGQKPSYGRSEEPNVVRQQALIQRQASVEQKGDGGTQFGQGTNIPYETRLDGLSSETVNTMRVCAGLRALSQISMDQNPMGGLAASLSEAELKNIQVCPELFDKEPDLLSFLAYNVMSLQGAVYRPGLYPVTDGGYLADVITAAGGTLRNADPNHVETTMQRGDAAVRQSIPLALARADFAVAPGASIRVGSLFSQANGGTVEIKGEVRNPGRYSLMRGERLSQLIERAGGYTDEAYVIGSVFVRDTVRKEEQQGYQRLAMAMEQSLPEAMRSAAQIDGGGQAAIMSSLMQTISSLKNAKASGRMVITADLATLQSSPSDDIILHQGDVLFVPRRPAHVMVSGEVRFAGAQRFEGGLSVDEYIRRAGGASSSADLSQTFVILPDGSSRAVDVDFWNYKEVQIPPGSTIVVPRDMEPLMFWSFARDAIDIFSNLALSAAALATINNN